MATAKTKKEKAIKTGANGEILADVKEVIQDGENTKTIEYTAPLDEVKDDNSNDENESDDEFSDGLDFDENEDFDEIPKSKLELMFDDLNIIHAQTQQTIFYAMPNRLPDAMNDNFRVRYNGDSPAPLGKFQFGLRDIFDFIAHIQKMNNDSGGRFSVTVYDVNIQPLRIAYGYSTRRQYRQIGIANLYIPNPIIDETPKQNQNQLSDREFFADMQRKADERLEKILIALAAPKEKSEIETKVLNAAIDRMINPPPQNDNNFASGLLKNELLQVEAIRKIFAEPPAPPPKTLADSVAEYANTEAGLEIIDTLKTIASALVSGKLQNNFQNVNTDELTDEQQNVVNHSPQQLTPEQENSNQLMIELITKATIELESENVINADNKLVKELSAQYPQQYQMLKIACLSQEFEQLLLAIATLAPDTIKPYIDKAFIADNGEIMLHQNNLVFAPEHLRMRERLNELYTFLKT